MSSRHSARKFFAIVVGLSILMGASACGANGSQSANGTKTGTSGSSTSKTPKPVTVYLGRHGQTTSNVMHRSQGWSDFTLTQEGVDGAKYLGFGLKGTKFAAAYSGDLTRQVKTAQGALKYSGNSSVKLTQDWRLRECNFGSFEGRLDAAQNDVDISRYYGYKDHADLVAKNGRDAAVVQQNGYYELDKANKLGTDLPEQFRAESAQAVEDRMTKVMTLIAQQQEKRGGGNVLIISSGSAINFFLYAQKFPEYTGAAIGNDAITKLTYKNGKFTLDGPIGSLEYFNSGKERVGK
ncbi:probable phosphoglycerate mutase [Bifidobacterium bohemicum]|nr:histidine phosphatase family protein [Bifidobacterium bohemicum]SCB87301.1 probable phosphoglycerate mutase [Bifidobacterium bohemicum]